MTDWAQIPIPEFMALVLTDEPLRILAGRIVLDRLPHTFDSKQQYFTWRDALAEGLEVDARDIVLVGSACTGRSLNPRTQFGVFNKGSDVDIAVVSSAHFDRAWSWFRRADPVLLGLDEKGTQLFEQHRAQYVFDGMIAANYFLSYLPFGNNWNRELQRSEKYLPARLQGRKLRVRIYKDSEALRNAQVNSIRIYQGVLRAKKEGGETTS